jgi:hypothetical protein
MVEVVIVVALEMLLPHLVVVQVPVEVVLVDRLA